jgi:hypothetical protein
MNLIGHDKVVRSVTPPLVESTTAPFALGS